MRSEKPSIGPANVIIDRAKMLVCEATVKSLPNRDLRVEFDDISSILASSWALSFRSTSAKRVEAKEGR